MWRRIELAMVLTAAVSQWGYFYLPAILGSEPTTPIARHEDPRRANRLPISSGYWAELTREGVLQRLRSLLDKLDRTFNAVNGSDPRRVRIDVIDNHGLLVIREDLGVRLLVNFSPHHGVRKPGFGYGPGTAHTDGEPIGPLQYSVW